MSLALPHDVLASGAVHAPTVILSLSVAVLGALVGLDLAGRARRAPDRLNAGLSIVAGAIAMGTGVWSMHFVGMSAVTYPFEAGVGFGLTVGSWALAVLVCTLPLGYASIGGHRRPAARGLCACATGAGVAVMHFVGVRAMELSPAPTYDLRWVVAAFVVSASVCWFALRALDGPDSVAPSTLLRSRLQAATLFGSGLALLHFMAMAAALFAPGTLCTMQGRMDARFLSQPTGVITLLFLGLMALVSTLERRAQRLALTMEQSLQIAQEELKRVTLNDVVTGLPNRISFQQRLGDAVRRCESGSHSITLLLVEVDDSARINRLLKDEGDVVLRTCAKALQAVAGPAWFVASAGGSRFMILGDGIDTQDPDDATRLATRIGPAIWAPLGTESPMRVTCSIGIALASDKGGADRIAGNASVALEAAQSRGGHAYAFFEPGMDQEAHEATEWLDDLRLAVERNELLLHYQPKVYAASGQIAGVEALLRWVHPTRGMVSPAIFIPLAERFGLINEIGDWVIDAAATQMATWSEEGLRLRVAINVSPSQLAQPDFAGNLLAALRKWAIDPGLLTCEITESGAMQDAGSTMAIFDRIKAGGVHLSIDDFGTGYSSLSQLRRIPLSQLKVDRSFVSDLDTSEDARAIVAAIIRMAHALRLEVVAEGVETASQRDILLALGCDKFQGYFFARPMPVAALTKFVTAAEQSPRESQPQAFVTV